MSIDDQRINLVDRPDEDLTFDPSKLQDISSNKKDDKRCSV